MAFGLSQYDLTTITRRLELPEISADPAKPLTLLVRFCGWGNKVWESRAFQRAAEAKAAADAPGFAATSPTFHAEHNAAMAEAAIVGWENVADDGVPVDYDAETAVRFLAELDERCPDLWRHVVLYVGERANFRSSPAIDAGALGKG